MLNTIVAESIDSLCEDLEAAMGRARRRGKTLDEALSAVIANSYKDAQAIIFAGDNYSDEWHAEAEKRGLLEPPLHPRRPAGS